MKYCNIILQVINSLIFKIHLFVETYKSKIFNQRQYYYNQEKKLCFFFTIIQKYKDY